MMPEAYTEGVSRKPVDPPTPLAAWVRDARGKISQADFAGRVSVHYVTVSRWESKGMGLRAKHIEAIRKAFPATPPPPVDGVSDPRSTLPLNDTERRYEVETNDGQFVGRQLDEIDDPAVRRRARNAALAAIEEERSKSHPSELGGDKRRHSAQRK